MSTKISLERNVTGLVIVNPELDHLIIFDSNDGMWKNASKQDYLIEYSTFVYDSVEPTSPKVGMIWIQTGA